MIKFRLRRLNVIVSIDSDNPNIAAAIAYEGDPALIVVAQREVEQQYGAFGHIIGGFTTPIDLHAAMNSPALQDFKPEILEGEEMVKVYDPKIPDNTKT